MFYVYMNSDLIWGQSLISRAKQTFMSVIAETSERVQL